MRPPRQTFIFLNEFKRTPKLPRDKIISPSVNMSVNPLFFVIITFFPGQRIDAI